ncbi:MAG TPA: PKD domain-containing protein [Thermoleophilaceae bacterium]|nr:PKD domain-containing protein [Thermoleophilaceae bacterium]
MIQVSERPAGGDWSEPQTISAGGGDSGPNAMYPQVAINAAGDAVVSWLLFHLQPGVPLIVVQAATRPAGDDWSPAEDLGFQDTNQDSPDGAIDAAGDAIVVWQGDVGGQDVIQAATRPGGDDWSAAQEIPNSGPGAWAPDVELDPAGNAVLLWLKGLFPIVQAAERPVGGAWSPPQPLSAPGGDAELSGLALGVTGDAVATWRRFDGSNGILQASARPAGGSWSVPQDVSDAGQDVQGQRVAVDAAGDAVALWSSDAGSDQVIQTALYDVTEPELHDVQIPAVGRVGDPVSFAVSPFDAFTSIATTSWSFGDGGPGATGDAVSHVYATAGAYPVTVTTFDLAGNKSAQTGTIAIAGLPSGPGSESPGPNHPGPAPGPDSPGPPSPNPRLTLSLAVEGRSLRKLLRTGKLVVAASVNEAATVRLTGKARLKARRKTQMRRAFKRKTAHFTEAGEQDVTLTLSRKGRRSLRGLRRVRLAIVGTATAAGDTARARAALTLRRSR